jgi:hypothetical protein
MTEEQERLLNSREGIKKLQFSSLALSSVPGEIVWQGKRVEISFRESETDDRMFRSVPNNSLGYRSICIPENGKGYTVDPDLLNWISVYLGEDVFPVRARLGFARPDLRGQLVFDIENLRLFLERAEAWCKTNLTDKWRKSRLDYAFGYFCTALAVNLSAAVPSVTLFATTLETLANTASFSSARHVKISGKDGPHTMFNNIKNSSIRKRITADIELLIKLRNTAGAHFGLHQERERSKLTNSLRNWMSRRGCTKEFAEISFLPDRLLDDLARSGHSLFLAGLTTTRACFFSLIDALRLMPFATGDIIPT